MKNNYEISNGKIMLGNEVIAVLPPGSNGANFGIALASLCSWANGGLDFERRKQVLIRKELVLIPVAKGGDGASWIEASNE